MNARICIACCAPLGANRTNEHIIADWLLQELGISGEQLIQIIADSVTGEIRNARRTHPMDAFREGRVCKKCNEGWMSVLESQAKLILPDMMNGRRSVTSVSPADCLVIARWTLKTAVILSHGSGLGQPIPPKHLQFLRDNPTDLPQQIGIFAATQDQHVSSHIYNEIIGSTWKTKLATFPLAPFLMERNTSSVLNFVTFS